MRALVQRVMRRAFALITRPRAELAIIEAEDATVAAMFRDYVAPLAAIPAVALLLRKLAGGVFDPFSALAGSLVAYVASLMGLYLIGEAAFRLASQFGSREDRVAAMKTVIYASTPVWLAGVVFILPPAFDFFFVFSLFSLYVLDRALPLLMKTPPDKLRGFEGAIAGVAIVVFGVLAAFAAVIA